MSNLGDQFASSFSSSSPEIDVGPNLSIMADLVGGAAGGSGGGLMESLTGGDAAGGGIMDMLGGLTGLPVEAAVNAFAPGLGAVGSAIGDAGFDLSAFGDW